jgi:hypothetical protein
LATDVVALGAVAVDAVVLAVVDAWLDGWLSPPPPQPPSPTTLAAASAATGLIENFTRLDCKKSFARFEAGTSRRQPGPRT